MTSPFVRVLRQLPTDAEFRLWLMLRDRRLSDYKFRRQRSIGRYVVDFVCIKHHLIVEADGGQHLDSASDAARTKWLEAQGWRVLRFWNHDILSNMDGVLETILAALREDAS